MDHALIAAAVLRGPDAIIAADREGIIRFWNAGAERIFGHPAPQAIGQSLDLIIPERLRARHWSGWQRVMAGGESRYGPGEVLAVPGIGPDGRPLSVEFTLHPLLGPDGEILGLAATVRDVTTRFEELRALRRRLSAIDSPDVSAPR